MISSIPIIIHGFGTELVLAEKTQDVVVCQKGTGSVFYPVLFCHVYLMYRLVFLMYAGHARRKKNGTQVQRTEAQPKQISELVKKRSGP